MFVISPDGRRAYTANVESGTVSVLDLQKRALVTVIPVAKHVQRITISADGRHVYTHDQDQPRIAVIDTLTNTVASYIPLPDAVYSSAAIGDGVTLVAASPSGKIFVIDTEKSKIVATVEVPPSSGEIIVTPDGYRVFLSCPQDGTIQFLDHLETKKPTLGAPIVLSKGVDGMAWTNSL